MSPEQNRNQRQFNPIEIIRGSLRFADRVLTYPTNKKNAFLLLSISSLVGTGVFIANGENYLATNTAATAIISGIWSRLL